MLLTLLDFVGTFVFALSGGTRAVQHRLDPFGVIFLAFVAAASGGIVRDVLIGLTPPMAIATWHYCAISALAGIACYFAYGLITRLSAPVAVFDAFGLGLFAVVGARKALDAGLSPLMAAMLGMMTAIGGGIARDVLTAQTPMVLRREVYALAALAGAAVVTFGDHFGMPYPLTAPLGAAITTGVRLVAIGRDWHLPTAKPE
ncbi:trimeric intracellular cation channel family protein [Pinisolibacter sp.]|uniref:trimeric intracellular cation channel family protein n=1 Tax=Pinisolibacter sp. TaxID=2172024 RepID=UPI002FDD7F9A